MSECLLTSRNTPVRIFYDETSLQTTARLRVTKNNFKTLPIPYMMIYVNKNTLKLSDVSGTLPKGNNVVYFTTSDLLVMYHNWLEFDY